MESRNTKDQSTATELRRRAEAKLQARAPEAWPPDTELEMKRLLHELQVHQIELEMQNAELCRSQEELENRVKERTTELVRINRELEQFCHGISHEFRAPIARLEGFGNMLVEIAEVGDKVSMVNCARRIVAASRRLRDVIDSLLALNRLSRAEIHLQKLNLSNMAKRVVAENLKNMGEYLVHVSIDPDVTATGDRDLLEICMKNLLGNAVKFSSKTPDASIKFGKRVIEGEDVYYVKDNGIGFDMEHAASIFLPFHRQQNDDEFEGTGTGLAAVHRIIEKHSGRIWAEAKPGAGATFYFTLQEPSRRQDGNVPIIEGYLW